MRSTKLNRLSLSALSDSQIILQVLEGDKELFEILIRRYNQRIYRVVRGYIKSEDDTMDIMQDAYVKAFTKLKQFNNEASFSTWLIRISINEALQYIRKKKRNYENYVNARPVEDIFNLPDSNQMNPEKQVIGLETRQMIERTVDRLPEKYRVVFILHQVEGLSNPEISECLNLTETNVKVRLHRAKNLLKAGLFEITHDSSIFEFGNHRCDAVVDGVMQRI